MSKEEIDNILEDIWEKEEGEKAEKVETVEKREPKELTEPKETVQVKLWDSGQKVDGKDVRKSVRKLRRLSGAMKKAVYGRDVLSNALVFALASNQHILIIGAHGEAKSLMVKKLVEFSHLKSFSTQVHNETIVRDIVGMINPVSYKEGKLDLIETKFWDANVLYFDEFLRGRTEFLDFLLEVLQERVCSKTVLGERALPVVSVIATSNPLTEDYNTDDRLDLALKDRFAFIMDVSKHLIETSPGQVQRILDEHDEEWSVNGKIRVTAEELVAIPRYARENVVVDTGILRELFDILKRDKRPFSTRFIKRFKECLQVWSLLNGRETANTKDYVDVGCLMLCGRYEDLNENGIKRAVGEAVNMKRFEQFTKDFDKLKKKKGVQFVKGYIELNEQLKNQSEASLPKRLIEKRDEATGVFGIEFQKNWKRVVDEVGVLEKMNTPAFEDDLRVLSETVAVRTGQLEKEKAKKFRDMVRKIDPAKKFFDLRSREAMGLDSKGKDIVKERFTIYPKVSNPLSFRKARELNVKAKEFFVKY